MDVEAPRSMDIVQNNEMRPGLKQALMVVNLILMVFGNSGGPMLSRLYFVRGGQRQWLSTWLLTGGWPLIFIPLYASYLYRRRRISANAAPFIFITPRISLACFVLGLITGPSNYLLTYGFSFLPVSTSSILFSTQLVFTALFAFLIVKQRFTPFSLNAVALLSVGAVILGIHTSSDRPEGVSKEEYFKGFFLTLGMAALTGLSLPLIELTYSRIKQAVTYTLVMEMQLVMGFFATGFCTVAMWVNHDFKAIPREARNFELGEVRYYVVLVFTAILWQLGSLGVLGVIFCTNTLLAGIIIAAIIPANGVLGVIFFHENFSGEKGVALALSLWGLASYSYGEYKEHKKKIKKRAHDLLQSTEISVTGSTTVPQSDIRKLQEVAPQILVRHDSL